LKLARSLLLFGATAIGGAGCKPNDSAPPIPEETAEAAPIDEGARSFHSYGPRRPPPARKEDRGASPGAGFFWAPGYHRWDGHDFVWCPGGWHAKREGYDYVAPHWEDVYARWEYVPGRWIRTSK
jgi:hypothetical protein